MKQKYSIGEILYLGGRNKKTLSGFLYGTVGKTAQSQYSLSSLYPKCSGKENLRIFKFRSLLQKPNNLKIENWNFELNIGNQKLQFSEQIFRVVVKTLLKMHLLHTEYAMWSFGSTPNSSIFLMWNLEGSNDNLSGSRHPQWKSRSRSQLRASAWLNSSYCWHLGNEIKKKDLSLSLKSTK